MGRYVSSKLFNPEGKLDRAHRKMGRYADKYGDSSGVYLDIFREEANTKAPDLLKAVEDREKIYNEKQVRYDELKSDEKSNREYKQNTTKLAGAEDDVKSLEKERDELIAKGTGASKKELARIAEISDILNGWTDTNTGEHVKGELATRQELRERVKQRETLLNAALKESDDAHNDLEKSKQRQQSNSRLIENVDAISTELSEEMSGIKAKVAADLHDLAEKYDPDSPDGFLLEVNDSMKADYLEMLVKGEFKEAQQRKMARRFDKDVRQYDKMARAASSNGLLGPVNYAFRNFLLSRTMYAEPLLTALRRESEDALKKMDASKQKEMRLGFYEAFLRYQEKANAKGTHEKGDSIKNVHEYLAKVTPSGIDTSRFGISGNAPARNGDDKKNNGDGGGNTPAQNCGGKKNNGGGSSGNAQGDKSGGKPSASGIAGDTGTKGGISAEPKILESEPAGASTKLTDWSKQRIGALMARLRALQDSRDKVAIGTINAGILNTVAELRGLSLHGNLKVALSSAEINEINAHLDELNAEVDKTAARLHMTAKVVQVKDEHSKRMAEHIGEIWNAKDREQDLEAALNNAYRRSAEAVTQGYEFIGASVVLDETMDAFGKRWRAFLDVLRDRSVDGVATAEISSEAATLQ